MRHVLCLLVLCPFTFAGGEDAPKVDVRSLPAGWRFQDLERCHPGTNGRVPCAIAEGGGRVAVAFPEPAQGRLTVRTNCFSHDWGDAESEYWSGAELSEKPLVQVGALIADDVLISWVQAGEKYDPNWTMSVGGPGRWQGFSGHPDAPPMPAYPAFALANATERGVFAVHNDPKSKALDYMAHPKGDRPPRPIPVGDAEEIVALAVQADGTIHALTCLEGKLLYLANKGGDPTRETVSTGKFTEIRGALAADASGAAHAAYRDAGTEGLLYRTNTSGKWVSVLVEGGAGVGMACAIAVDAKGKEHICYTVGGGVRYATNAAGSWQVFSVATGKTLPGCGIAIDKQGHVHLCFAVDRVMRYATNRPQDKREK